jgi:hypothetical protein
MVPRRIVFHRAFALAAATKSPGWSGASVGNWCEHGRRLMLYRFGGKWAARRGRRMEVPVAIRVG